MIGHVYRILNKETGSFYIGASVNVERRFQTHMRDLLNKKHHSFTFQAEYDLHGKDAFVLEILGEFAKKDLKDAEQDHINRLQPSLNVSKLAGCGDLISYHPKRDEIAEKISKSNIERFSRMTPQERAALQGRPGEANPMFGKTHNESARRSISEANKGKRYALGVKRTQAQKDAISERAKLRTGEKNPFFGRSHSNETKEKLSKARKGKIPTNTKKVQVGDVVFESGAAAARALGISSALVVYRIKKSPKFGLYQYVN